MLSAKRDRLALVTQLLVPIALVLVALWARQATDAFPQEPVLDISRQAAHFSSACDDLESLYLLTSAPNVPLAQGQVCRSCISSGDIQTDRQVL